MVRNGSIALHHPEGLSYGDELLQNPNLPKVRAEAVKLLRSGRSTREVARRFGYNQSTIVRWNRKVHPELRQFRIIPTESSRPAPTSTPFWTFTRDGPTPPDLHHDIRPALFTIFSKVLTIWK